jgi:hypothetical protein
MFDVFDLCRNAYQVRKNHASVKLIYVWHYPSENWSLCISAWLILVGMQRCMDTQSSNSFLGEPSAKPCSAL